MTVRARTLRGVTLCAAATVPVAAGSLVLMISAPAGAVSLGGVATLAPPGTTAATPLRSGGSATLFTVALPTRASCLGDTASDGYHVYSYLVKKGTDLAAVRFVDGPSMGYGIVDTTSTYFGAINTARKTGQIVGVPNDFAWAPLVQSGGGPLALSHLLYGGSTGVWETGLACANVHGALSNNWNTQITFSADAGDPHGFRWTADPSVSTPTGTTGVVRTGMDTSSGSASVSVTPAAPPMASAAAGSSTSADPYTAGSTSSRPANTVPSNGSAPVGTADGTAEGSDLPTIGIVAAGLLVVGAAIAVLLKARPAR